MRVLVLSHLEYTPPRDISTAPVRGSEYWRTEYDVLEALATLGHETKILGALSELTDVRECLQDWKPKVVFNLMEEFGGEGVYMPYVLGYLQLKRVSFTGCNPASLLLADNKALAKKILRYHRIPVPGFAVFPRGRRVHRPRRLGFPLIVKSATAHGSAGISQASVVDSDAKLVDRVAFIHDVIETDAMVEEFIAGREIYVGVIGNNRLETFPFWELHIENLAEGSVRIATSKAKFDPDYQETRGIHTGPAKKLPPETVDRMGKLCKRVYRVLGLTGYARMDFRISPEGKVYLLEPNPNPDLAEDEDFADAALAAGIDYQTLIRRILNLALRYRATWG